MYLDDMLGFTDPAPDRELEPTADSAEPAVDASNSH